MIHMVSGLGSFPEALERGARLGDTQVAGNTMATRSYDERDTQIRRVTLRALLPTEPAPQSIDPWRSAW